MDTIEAVVHDIFLMGIDLKSTDIHIDINLETHHQSIIYRRHKKNVGEYNLEGKEENIVFKIFEHLKLIFGFDLSKHHEPQTGRYSFEYCQTYYMRFAALNSVQRSKGVIRILNMNIRNTLEESVKTKRQVTEIIRMMNLSDGLIVFSGITGSGKTTTMFNALKAVSYRMIYCIENPIERYHNEIIQLEIKAEVGVTELFMHVLRHDPDVIVFGEVRNSLEMKNVIEAAFTGHLICITLHAGSLEQCLDRMVDLGACKYDIMNLLKGVVVHRLKEHRGEIKVEQEIFGPKAWKNTE